MPRAAIELRWDYRFSRSIGVAIALISLVGAAPVLGQGEIVGWGDTILLPDEAISGLIEFSAGHTHSLGLTSDGSIVAWGGNSSGQCNVPEPNTGFVAVAAGGSGHYEISGYVWEWGFSCGLKSDSTVVAWGSYMSDESGIPGPDEKFVSISACAYHALGLRTDGSLRSWGLDTALPTPNAEFVAISAGGTDDYPHDLALRYDGSIVAFGVITSVPAPNTNFIAVSAGGYHNLGLKSDGSIIAWGSNSSGQCNVPLPNSDFVAIAAGREHSLGLKTDGSIVAWGSNSGAFGLPTGQCNVPEPNIGFIGISAGGYRSLGLREDGVLVTWGDNSTGQGNIPPPNQGFHSVASGSRHCLALRNDGSIVTWGKNYRDFYSRTGQCDVPEPNNDFTAVAAGVLHSLGLKNSGTIVAWGSNYDMMGSFVGQCDVPEPNSGFLAVAARGYNSAGLRTDGSIVVWGENPYGQCNVPAPNTDFIAVTCGQHMLGLKATGEIVAWGDNNYGQCDVPSPNTGFVAIASGGSHSLGLRSDGSIVAWGANVYGQCNVPAPNEDYVAIAVGSQHSLGVKRSGIVVAWGCNDSGQCDLGPLTVGISQVVACGTQSLALRSSGYGYLFRLYLQDVGCDQGGVLSAGWNRHWRDNSGIANRITYYDIQKLNETWNTIVTVEAAEADTYSVNFGTTDVFTVGETEPYSTYRVVARTNMPELYYVSAIDSCYTIDNLSPPQPEVQLLEYDGLNVVTWALPEIPDLNEACVYRGTTPNFIPDEPLGCTTQTVYPDLFDVMAYYRVQFSDIHGNLSEFSEAVHPISTAVGDVVQAKLELLPPYPNPFNPRTTVSFTLPEAGQAVVSIYDARGMEVARLVDGTLAAGLHSVDWEGRDAYGASMPSGTYFCRLTTPWGVETRKVQLVR